MNRATRCGPTCDRGDPAPRRSSGLCWVWSGIIRGCLRYLKEQATKKGTDEVFNAALIGGLAGAAAGIGVIALIELLKNQKE